MSVKGRIAALKLINQEKKKKEFFKEIGVKANLIVMDVCSNEQAHVPKEEETHEL